MKTCLYNFYPLKPHFYIVKLGFTGVYIAFLIFAHNHRLWVLVRTASARRRGGSNEYPQSIFDLIMSRNMKISEFFIWNFSVKVKFSIYLKFSINFLYIWIWVWQESTLSAFWVDNGARGLRVDNKDHNKTAAGAHGWKYFFSCSVPYLHHCIAMY